ncbi:MAG: hypothetical protein OEM83_05265, partial [Gammaproteobacteria bacterium]|nr:hypothetical protein [Gammaproteobacteria bacterium]
EGNHRLSPRDHLVSVPSCGFSATGQDFVPRDDLRAEGNDGPAPLSQTAFPEEDSIMLKLSFWIGTPSIITYLASTYSQLLENIYYLFALSAAALIMAILSQIGEKTRS